MGDVEYDKCDICGVEGILSRKYYRYPIKCDCCNSKNDPHFEIVRYCKNCEPKPPRRVSVVMNPLTEIELREFKINKINEKI